MTEEKKTDGKKIEGKKTDVKKTSEVNETTEVKKKKVGKKEESIGVDKNELDQQDENGLLTLPMIPLRGLSIFPNMVLHFDIGREKSINALEKAMIMNQKVFLVTQKDENTDLPT